MVVAPGPACGFLVWGVSKGSDDWPVVPSAFSSSGKGGSSAGVPSAWIPCGIDRLGILGTGIGTGDPASGTGSATRGRGRGIGCDSREGLTTAVDRAEP